MTEIELFAKHYFGLGLNVTCISNRINEHNFYCRNILKTPNHKWKHFFTQRQIQTEFQKYEWDTATGVGSVTGFQDLRVIDIDGCNDYDFLDKTLALLELPANYEWVTLSGSKNGFHIFIISNKFSYLDESQVVTTFPPKEEYKHMLEKVEILLNIKISITKLYQSYRSFYVSINWDNSQTISYIMSATRNHIHNAKI